MPLVWRTLPWLVLLALLGIAVVPAVPPLEALFTHIPLNYNEGWNAFHTLRLRSGGPLYPPLSEAIVNNYTPLSFYVVAALHPLVGDDIVAGRLVALLAEIAVAANIALGVRALGISHVLAGSAALAFFAFVAVYYPDYVAMDDPQWLGHALQTGGLLLVLRRNRLDWTTLLGVAALCLAGGLVKQNLVALPLAVTVWLAIEDRRTLLRWLASAAGLAALALAALVGLYGQGFIDQVLRSERRFWPDALAFTWQHLAIRVAPYLAFALAGTLLQRRDRRIRLVGIYLLVSLLSGLVMLGIDGVAYNALFDLTIAMMLGAAILCDWLTDRLGRMPALAPASPAIGALLLALPLLALGRLVFDVQSDLRLDLARQAAWQQSIDRIAAAPGPIACEMLSLCYWAGRPSAVDFFNFGQHAGLHPGSGDALLARLGQHEFALIQEDSSSGTSRRLPSEFNTAIGTNYVAVQSEPTTLLSRR